MSAADEPLSEEECALLLAGRRCGDIGAANWTRLLRQNPELAAFVRDVEARERRDADSVGAVLKRCGYRVN